MKRVQIIGILVIAPILGLSAMTQADYPAVPDTAKLRSAFSKKDQTAFRHPDRIFYPETWFHFINTNIRREGITRDLEAIAASGIQGVQFFHGQMGDTKDWPSTEEHVKCLSPEWEELVRHTAEEAHRLGLRFSLQTTLLPICIAAITPSAYRSPALGSTAWSMMPLCQRSNERHGSSMALLPENLCARLACWAP